MLGASQLERSNAFGTGPGGAIFYFSLVAFASSVVASTVLLVRMLALINRATEGLAAAAGRTETAMETFVDMRSWGILRHGDIGCLTHIAARKGMARVLDVLVQHGANPVAVDSIGRTPLDIARVEGMENACERLEILTAATWSDECTMLSSTRRMKSSRLRSPRGAGKFGDGGGGEGGTGRGGDGGGGDGTVYRWGRIQKVAESAVRWIHHSGRPSKKWSGKVGVEPLAPSASSFSSASFSSSSSSSFLSPSSPLPAPLSISLARNSDPGCGEPFSPCPPFGGAEGAEQTDAVVVASSSDQRENNTNSSSSPHDEGGVRRREGGGTGRTGVGGEVEREIPWGRGGSDLAAHGDINETSDRSAGRGDATLGADRRDKKNSRNHSVAATQGSVAKGGSNIPREAESAGKNEPKTDVILYQTLGGASGASGAASENVLAIPTLPLPATAEGDRSWGGSLTCHQQHQQQELGTGGGGRSSSSCVRGGGAARAVTPDEELRRSSSSLKARALSTTLLRKASTAAAGMTAAGASSSGQTRQLTLGNIAAGAITYSPTQSVLNITWALRRLRPLGTPRERRTAFRALRESSPFHIPPMYLLAFVDMATLGEIPKRTGDRFLGHASARPVTGCELMARADELGQDPVVVYVSHRWLEPDFKNPDDHSKARFYQVWCGVGWDENGGGDGVVWYGMG